MSEIVEHCNDTFLPCHRLRYSWSLIIC